MQDSVTLLAWVEKLKYISMLTHSRSGWRGAEGHLKCQLQLYLRVLEESLVCTPSSRGSDVGNKEKELISQLNPSHCLHAPSFPTSSLYWRSQSVISRCKGESSAHTRQKRTRIRGHKHLLTWNGIIVSCTHACVPTHSQSLHSHWIHLIPPKQITHVGSHTCSQSLHSH